MAREAINQDFYDSAAWRKCRAAYIASVGGLCEECKAKGRLTPGVIVHHVVPLTRRDVGDPDVALGWDNLRLLCLDCHNDIHNPLAGRVRFDADGNVLPAPMEADMAGGAQAGGGQQGERRTR